MKFNNETIRAAVKEWLDDEIKAESKYGFYSRTNGYPGWANEHIKKI